jgi:uncharacterized membrane protein
MDGERKEKEKSMDTMLVVVFDEESKAFDAKKALGELEEEDMIAIYAQAVVSRNADGSATVRQSDDPRPVETMLGTSLGSLIGLFGGPVGLAIGAATGLAIGSIADVNHARIGEAFIAEVKQKLLPEKFALVAEIEEDTTAPVDRRMQALGGTTIRQALSEVKQKVSEQNAANRKAEMAESKAKHAETQAGRKAKLQERMNQFDTKIQGQLEKAKQRRHTVEERENAKVEVLKAKAAALQAQAPKREV